MLRDEDDAYARRLSEAGCRVSLARFPSLAHGFVNMTGVCPAALAALTDVALEWRALLDAADGLDAYAHEALQEERPR